MSKSAKFSQLFGMVLGVAVVVGSGYLVWIIAARLLLFLERADPSVAAAVVGAMATIMVGMGGVLYTQAQTKKREIEEAHRAKKVEIYKELLDMIARMMTSENPNVSHNAPSDQELVDFLVGFKTNLLLWASPKVINAQLNFQKVSSSGGNVLAAD